jgi:pimeloyl-ACP methyl ester carboxylesterase
LEKLRTFICEDLVFDAGQVTEAPLRALSGIIQPDVLANPPLRIPPDPAAFRRLDFLLDPRLSRLEHPTLVLWGVNDRVNRPDGAAALQRGSAALRCVSVQSHRSLGAMGARGGVQRRACGVPGRRPRCMSGEPR